MTPTQTTARALLTADDMERAAWRHADRCAIDGLYMTADRKAEALAAQQVTKAALADFEAAVGFLGGFAAIDRAVALAKRLGY